MAYDFLTLPVFDADGILQNALVIGTVGNVFAPAHIPVDINGNPATSAIANATGGCSLWGAFGSEPNPYLGNTVVQVASGQASLYGLEVYNFSVTEPAFIQIFDALAVNVVLGTTVPKIVLVGPQVSLISRQYPNESKWAFQNGISIAATSTTLGSGAVDASVLAAIQYQQ